MNNPVKRAIPLLKKIFKESSIDEGHGIEHALAVLSNTNEALKYLDLEGPGLEKLETDIRLASLLHDADDRKFFKGTSNAKKILEEVLPDIEDAKRRQKVLEMIDLVSCSKNGLDIDMTLEEWMYYPRWSDRLEALGRKGILRAYQYSVHKGRPLDTKKTPRTNSPHLLYGMIATPRRFEKYLKVKESDSFIDHFYDKILHLRKDFTTNNHYYICELNKRHQIVEDFILEYCTLDSKDIKNLVEKYTT